MNEPAMGDAAQYFFFLAAVQRGLPKCGIDFGFRVVEQGSVGTIRTRCAAGVGDLPRAHRRCSGTFHIHLYPR